MPGLVPKFRGGFKTVRFPKFSRSLSNLSHSIGARFSGLKMRTIGKFTAGGLGLGVVWQAFSNKNFITDSVNSLVGAIVPGTTLAPEIVNLGLLGLAIAAVVGILLFISVRRK